MIENQLPAQISKHTKRMICKQNNVGCSEAGVYKFYSKKHAVYLKKEPKDLYLQREYECLLWMQNKLPVPEIIEWCSDNEFDYLLMSEVPGKMLCDDYYKQNPEEGVKILAQGINLFRSVDINDCPNINGISQKLMEAEKNILNNRVDMDDWESDNRFENPEALLDYLHSNKPQNEELSFTHGDFCLPNIIAERGNITGFIDVNNAGVADIWQDIALCMRSIRYNYGSNKYDKLFLNEIGISLDEQKLEYYILLDELF